MDKPKTPQLTIDREFRDLIRPLMKDNLLEQALAICNDRHSITGKDLAGFDRLAFPVQLINNLLQIRRRILFPDVIPTAHAHTSFLLVYYHQLFSTSEHC